MKKSKKLEDINQKIAELTTKKQEIEKQIAIDISKNIADMIIKKNAVSIDMTILQKNIEQIIDNMLNNYKVQCEIVRKKLKEVNRAGRTRWHTSLK